MQVQIKLNKNNDRWKTSTIEKQPPLFSEVENASKEVKTSKGPGFDEAAAEAAKGGNMNLVTHLPGL